MLNSRNLVQARFALIALALFLVPRTSYADWGDHQDRDHNNRDHVSRDYHDRGQYYRYHDHPHYGLHLHYLPDGYFSIWAGGARYYYYDGLYYNNVGGDYVIVAPPQGAVVASIPSDFQPVVVNGGTYYVNNGTYYAYTPHGYQVVSAPVTVVQPATVVAPQAVPVAPQGFFTINIPNKSGGYTPVVIKRAKSGYEGPQGEFYPDFPKVVQLKVMYGK
jgi:hypothetical protein